MFRSSLRFLTGSASLLATRILGAAIGFATQILLARSFSAADLGLFYLATSIAALIGTLATFGYPGIAVRFISRYRVRSQPGLVLAFIRESLNDTTRTALWATAVIIAICLLVPLWDWNTRVAIAAGALSIPAIAMSRMNSAIAVAFRQFNLAFLPELLFRPVLFLAAIALLVLLSAELTALTAVTLMSIIALGVTFRQGARTKTHFPDGPPAREDRRRTRAWRITGSPLIILTVAALMLADVDLAMLGAIMPKDQLALFGVCIKIAALVGFAVQLLHDFVSPEISEAMAAGNRVRLRQAITRTNLALVAMMLAATLGAMLAGGYALRIFGPEFAEAQTAFVILVATQIVRAGCGPSNVVLVAAGAQRSVALVLALSLIVLALANLALVPRYGVNGAALAILATMSFSTITMSVLAARIAHCRTDIGDSVQMLWPRLFGPRTSP